LTWKSSCAWEYQKTYLFLGVLQKEKKIPITKLFFGITLSPDEHGWHRKKICTKSLDIILLHVELTCLSFKVEDIYNSEPLPNLYLHCLFVFVTDRERDREREGFSILNTVF